jgi:hypothetical protein
MPPAAEEPAVTFRMPAQCPPRTDKNDFVGKTIAGPGGKSQGHLCISIDISVTPGIIAGKGIAAAFALGDI